MKYVLVWMLSASLAQADPVADVMAAAEASFARMPDLARVETVAGHCGANDKVNTAVAYCTSENRIYLAAAAAVRPEAAYQVAHVLGHAVQVQHGIADIALREITRRRSEEGQLRGAVTAQVECIAGFLLARAALPAVPLSTLFSGEPFTGSHWGRSPLRGGPRVSVGLAARDAWLQRGHAADDLGACATEAFGAELLLEAYRG